MDTRTEEILAHATADFYAKECQSFSATRQAPWVGWNRVADMLPEDDPLRVLDLGCGNMRFERFLTESFPKRSFEAYAFDNCIELADQTIKGVDIDFMAIDLCDTDFPTISVPPCGASVAFGVMHHIPSFDRRKKVMEALAANTRPGGVMAISFWQFTKSERLSKLAQKATRSGCRYLDIALSSAEGDYLLGWQGHPNIYRYCHDFTDEEVEALTESVKGFTPLDIFNDDGGLNRYVILKRDID